MELLQYDVGRSGRLWSVFIHVGSSYAAYEKSSTPSRLLWDANVASVSLFWMADRTSWEKRVFTTITIAWKQRKSINIYMLVSQTVPIMPVVQKIRTIIYSQVKRSTFSTCEWKDNYEEAIYLIIRCKNGIVRCCVYSFYVEVLIFGSQLHCQWLNFKHWDHWDHTIRRWVVTVYSNCSTSGRLTKRRWWPDIKKTRAVNFFRITVCLQILFIKSSAAMMAPYVILLKPTTLVTLVGTVVIFSALPMLFFVSWHHRSLKLNTGREGTQLFDGIWECCKGCPNSTWRGL